MVQRILVIDTPRDLQIQRTTERDTASEEQVEAIINSQTDRETRLAAADDILENHGDIASLHRQIDVLHNKYLALSRADGL